MIGTVEQWARALCRADNVDPDKIIGNPPNPRWMSFQRYARQSMDAYQIVAAEAEKEGRTNAA